jgi:hypothetical protein
MDRCEREEASFCYVDFGLHGTALFNGSHVIVAVPIAVCGGNIHIVHKDSRGLRKIGGARCEIISEDRKLKNNQRSRESRCEDHLMHLWQTRKRARQGFHRVEARK